MSATPKMHHVVYAVAPERLDAATAFFPNSDSPSALSN